MKTSSDSEQPDRLALIEEMRAEQPDDPFLDYAAALEYLKREAFDVALKRLESLRLKHPEYLALYYQLGQTYSALGKVEDAIDAYREGQGVARNQNDQKTLGELSEALLLLDAD